MQCSSQNTLSELFVMSACTKSADVEMSCIDKWWLSEYAGDIASTMQKKEKERIPFFFQSPQLQYREHLVSWLCRISQELKMCNTCIHLAVYLLDIFMDNHSIEVERLNLVALVCLLLSAKLEECDANIPKITELNHLVENQYPMNDFISLEFMFMEFLKWSLVIPTAAHFAEYFVLFVTVPNDLQYVCNIESAQHLQDIAQKYVKNFLDHTLHEPQMLHFRPSLVAASCVAAVRQCLGLPDKWTPLLCNITQYKLYQLEPCLHILLRNENVYNRHRKRKAFESPDHGYGTDSTVFSSPELSSSK